MSPRGVFVSWIQVGHYIPAGRTACVCHDQLSRRENGMRGFNRRLEQLSLLVSKWSGSIWAFALALLIVIVWAATGPFVGFSDTWQLVINTGTTIVTFLMVFLVQRAQNKESLAIQAKLDELIASQ